MRDTAALHAARSGRPRAWASDVAASSSCCFSPRSVSRACCRTCRTAPRPLKSPPPLRTNRIRRVPHPVLIGHAASLTPTRACCPLPPPARRRVPPRVGSARAGARGSLWNLPVGWDAPLSASPFPPPSPAAPSPAPPPARRGEAAASRAPPGPPAPRAPVQHSRPRARSKSEAGLSEVGSAPPTPPPLPTVAPTRVPSVHIQSLQSSGTAPRRQPYLHAGLGVLGARRQPLPVLLRHELRRARRLRRCRVLRHGGIPRLLRLERRGLGPDDLASRALEPLRDRDHLPPQIRDFLRDETCPVSTGGGTRRVQSVRGGGGIRDFPRPAAAAPRSGNRARRKIRPRAVGRRD